PESIPFLKCADKFLCFKSSSVNLPYCCFISPWKCVHLPLSCSSFIASSFCVKHRYLRSCTPGGALCEPIDRGQYDSDQQQNPGKLDCHCGHSDEIQDDGHHADEQKHQCVVGQHDSFLSMQCERKSTSPLSTAGVLAASMSRL